MLNTDVIDAPFALLSPDAVLDAVEGSGYQTNGRILALNSYENRVYQVGIEEADPIIVKFYRPQRWTTEQIIEEHQFTQELTQHEVSAVPPLLNSDGSTLSQSNNILFALFQRKGGRAPELDNFEHLYILGQHLGRLHAVGKAAPFSYRQQLTAERFGLNSIDFLLKNYIPKSLQQSYQTLTRDLMGLIDRHFSQINELQYIRCHGDCHQGNVLWRDDIPHFVDFDDACMAPAIQDLWMLLSGDRYQQSLQLSEVIEGYEMFCEFNRAEISLIEPLRTLRMIHYAAWLGRRWHDPAFPMHFPWFNSERYWGEHILQLREQLYALQEPSLQLL